MRCVPILVKRHLSSIFQRVILVRYPIIIIVLQGRYSTTDTYHLSSSFSIRNPHSRHHRYNTSPSPLDGLKLISFSLQGLLGLGPALHNFPRRYLSDWCLAY